MGKTHRTGLQTTHLMRAGHGYRTVMVMKYQTVGHQTTSGYKRIYTLKATRGRPQRHGTIITSCPSPMDGRLTTHMRYLTPGHQTIIWRPLQTGRLTTTWKQRVHGQQTTTLEANILLWGMTSRSLWAHQTHGLRTMVYSPPMVGVTMTASIPHCGQVTIVPQIPVPGMKIYMRQWRGQQTMGAASP